jgi:hypothetical protein
MKIKQLMLFDPVGVWVIAAGFGSVLIDGTVFISAQKRTGHGLEHLIAILIFSHVFLHEIRILHPKVFSYTLDVRICKQWASGRAAVGTLQTVDA